MAQGTSIPCGCIRLYNPFVRKTCTNAVPWMMRHWQCWQAAERFTWPRTAPRRRCPTPAVYKRQAQGKAEVKVYTTQPFAKARVVLTANGIPLYDHVGDVSPVEVLEASCLLYTSVLG